MASTGLERVTITSVTENYVDMLLADGPNVTRAGLRHHFDPQHACPVGENGIALLVEVEWDRYRYTALSLSKEIGAIASGGTAPIIASALLLWFHHAWWPVATYMALFALITFITTFIAPETKGRDLELEEDAV